MKFFLIILIVFVAISPLLSMAPGRRQRQLARVRQHAQTGGLVVGLKEPPVSSGQRPSDGKMACYRLQRHPDETIKGVIGKQFFPSEEGWHGSGEVEGPVRSLLQQLPAGCAAVSIDGHGCSVYWDESGDTEAVDLLRGIMVDLLGLGRQPFD